MSVRASGAARVRPPYRPVKIVIRVMPIWIADRSVVGSSIRAIADFAPVRPCSAAACSRERLAETSAISDSAKKPLRRMSRRMTRTSLELMEATDPAGVLGAQSVHSRRPHPPAAAVYNAPLFSTGIQYGLAD